ncbi:hypothetical protein FRC01_003353 [Tulasnella sp. 417]|nr:hypothetical protein FRC01_003353 [Tulasnella sp. 417]
MHWRAAMYRSPRSALPIWTSVCLDHTPLLCLIGAVLAFSTGLVVWTFAADLAFAVKLCAAGMTCATSLILLTVIFWEAGEWWQENKKNQPTPTASDAIAGMPAPHYPWQPWKNTKRAAGDARSQLSDVIASGRAFLGKKWRQFVSLTVRRPTNSDDPPTLSLPSTNPLRRNAAHLALSRQTTKRVSVVEQGSASRKSSVSNLGQELELPDRETLAPFSPVTARSGILSFNKRKGPPSPLDRRALQDSEPLEPQSPGTALSTRFALDNRRDPPPPLNRKTSPVMERFRRVGRSLIENDALRVSMRGNRPENSRPRREELRSLCPVQMFPIYHRTGRDIQFSPDGTRLAISLLDGNLAIWEVGKYDEEAQLLRAPLGRFTWSPDGSYIVIIMDNGLSIWNKDSSWTAGEIHRPIGVVAWLQEPSTFLAVIDQVPHIFDTGGKVRERLNHLPFHVHDLASMPSQLTKTYGFFLVLGTLIDDDPEWTSGSIFTKTLAKRPKDALAERRLMVIDADSDACFAEASILADARHICVSQEGSFALVSYANGDCPELWQLQDSQGEIQLELCRGYAPPSASSPDREVGGQHSVSGKARFW